MKKNLLKEAYNVAPEQIKRFCQIVPFKWRMGRRYRQTIDLLMKSQYWSIEESEEYQLDCLRSVLEHAYLTVPYYRQVFDKICFKPRDLSSLLQLEKLPLLSRDVVANNFDRLKSSKYSRFNSYEGLTGGTTGSAIRVLFDLESYFTEWAFLHNLWARVGFSPNQKRIALIGTPFQRNRRVTIKYDQFHNELQLSALDMDETTLRHYAEAISRFKPSYLYGLPSALTVLAAYLSENHSIPGDVRAVLCASEQLGAEQVQFLETTFKCRAYSWYGQTEKVALAGECEHSREYHLLFE
jgi:phenylacetate-CoA ligase